MAANVTPIRPTGSENRSPWHDSETAERALCSALILAPHRIPEAAEIAAPADMVHPVTRAVYSTLLDLHHEGRDVELVTIAERIAGKPAVPDQTNILIISILDIIDDRAGEWEALHWARAVRHAALLRALSMLAGQLVSDPSSAQLAGEHQRTLAALEALRAGHTGPPARYSFESFWDIPLDTSCQYLVKGVLDDGAMGVVYGPSNSGKTFAVLDLALSVASGRPWLGRRVQQGLVVYVVAEGARGFARRIAAYRQEVYRGAADLRFHVLRSAVNFLDEEGDVRPLIASIRRLEKDTGHRCALVVVDTLSRAMPGGNENAPEDMSSLVSNGDHLRREIGSALIWVHHSGKDVAKGARGHSSLRAATDTEFEVSADPDLGWSTIEDTKQRDMSRSLHQTYRMREVEIGVDDEGDPITSCVVEAVEREELAEQARERISKPSPSGQAVVNVLDKIHNDASRLPGEIFDADPGVSDPMQTGWRESDARAEFIAERDDGQEKTYEASRKAFRRGLDDLREKGLIGTRMGWVWFTSKGAKCPRK